MLPLAIVAVLVVLGVVACSCLAAAAIRASTIASPTRSVDVHVGGRVGPH